MHYFWWYMSSFIKSKMLSQFLVDHMTIQAFSRRTSISQTPQHTVVRVLSSPPCQQVSAMRTKTQNELSAQELASSWLFWPNGQAGRVLSHMNCNYTSMHTWNPSSSGRKVEAWTQWQWYDVCRLWSHLPANLFIALLFRMIPVQQWWLVDFSIVIHMLTQSATVPLEAHGRQLESFSFPMSSSTDPSVLT